MLIYSSSWKESKRMKAPICLKPLLSRANNVRKKLTPSVLDLLFIFWTSGVPLWFAQSPSSLLTLLVLNKADPDSPLCSGYYNVASTSAKSEQGQEQGASGLSGESNGCFLILQLQSLATINSEKAQISMWYLGYSLFSAASSCSSAQASIYSVDVCLPDLGNLVVSW